MNGELCIIGQEKSDTNLKLLEEAKKKFGSVLFVPIESIGVGLTEKFSITYRATDLFRFKAILSRIPKNFCSYAYQLLSLFPQETYMPIKPISYLLAGERFFLLTVLRKREVDTINLRLARSTKAARGIIEGNTFPLIIRTPDKKTGVVVKNSTEAKSIIDALASLHQTILIEDVVKDMVSVYVAEPDIIAAVKKKTKEKDIIFAPGDYKKAKLSIEIEQLALAATRGIETQLARVDISTTGEPKVVNIELNPDLVTPSRVCGIDITERIINTVYDNFEEHKQKPLLVKFFEDAKSVMKDVLKTKQLL
jgi:glutathione synthase/RimK-type ligase-like ATP-grasp enzyme